MFFDTCIVYLWLVLTLCHTMPTFNNHENEAFKKLCRKMGKCWLPEFSPFPTMLYTLPTTKFNFLVTFILSSANASDLDQSEMLSFGKE